MPVPAFSQRVNTSDYAYKTTSSPCAPIALDSDIKIRKLVGPFYSLSRQIRRPERLAAHIWSTICVINRLEVHIFMSPLLLTADPANLHTSSRSFVTRISLRASIILSRPQPVISAPKERKSRRDEKVRRGKNAQKGVEEPQRGNKVQRDFEEPRRGKESQRALDEPQRGKKVQRRS